MVKLLSEVEPVISIVNKELELDQLVKCQENLALLRGEDYKNWNGKLQNSNFVVPKENEEEEKEVRSTALASSHARTSHLLRAM